MPPSADPASLRAHCLEIFDAALRAVDPVTLVARSLADEPEVQRWSHEIAAMPDPGPREAVPGDRSGLGSTLLVAVGKAALGMTRGAVQLLGGRVDEGLVLAPHSAVERRGDGSLARPEWLPAQIRLRSGGHPLPDADGVGAASEIAELVGRAGPRDRILVLLSGGGSALMSLPRPGLGLQELRETTRILLEAGLPIRELNRVRHRLDVLKGGGMAARARPARVLALLLSDVAGDDPAVVASGPLTPTDRTARQVEIDLRRRGVWDRLPQAARKTLREARDEAGGPGGPEPVVRLVGGGGEAVEAAARAARERGYATVVLKRDLAGEARRVGRGLARAAAAVQDGLTNPRPPACLLAAGETTVQVTGSGRGGRNQEVALGAASVLDGRGGVLVASLGTDGIDGPTDAAGGMADGATVQRARASGRSVEDALARNDAYPLLDGLGDLIRTGPTGTNVADLMMALVTDPPARRSPDRR